MKKLRLNPDHLEVQSFETSELVAERGTVRGNESQLVDSCVVANTCLCNPTVEATCGAGCGTETGSLSVCGCATAACTGNPGEISCYNTYDFCFETQRPLHTCEVCV
jgi:hypothetical protein